MNILYRPVTKTKGALYSIESYSSEKQDNRDKWLDVNMDIHFGCFFFFNRILKELTKDTLKSLREAALEDQAVNPHTKRILQESGHTTRRTLSVSYYKSILRRMEDADLNVAVQERFCPLNK